MRPDTAEWIKKADADFLSMTREMNAVKDLNYDLVCLLAQQSVEKYLKALLCETSVPFPKTHDLIAQEVQPMGKVPPITGKLLDGQCID